MKKYGDWNLALLVTKSVLYSATVKLFLFAFLLAEMFSCSILLLKAEPSSTLMRRRRALSESGDDEPIIRHSSPIRENSADLQESDGEIRDRDKTNGDDALDD